MTRRTRSTPVRNPAGRQTGRTSGQPVPTSPHRPKVQDYLNHVHQVKGRLSGHSNYTPRQGTGQPHGQGQQGSTVSRRGGPQHTSQVTGQPSPHSPRVQAYLDHLHQVKSEMSAGRKPASGPPVTGGPSQGSGWQPVRVGNANFPRFGPEPNTNTNEPSPSDPARRTSPEPRGGNPIYDTGIPWLDDELRKMRMPPGSRYVDVRGWWKRWKEKIPDMPWPF